MLHGTSNVYVLPFLFVDCSARVKNVLSRCILIFWYIYILAVSAYPCFWKMPYHRIAVSVSAYQYPVSVQRRVGGSVLELLPESSRPRLE